MLDAFDDEVSRLPSGEGSKVMAANYVAGRGKDKPMSKSQMLIN